jgi:hypothetical protein
MHILVDSNVILDVVKQDATWERWSARQISEYGPGNRLAINPIVFAEVSYGFDRIEEVHNAIPRDIFLYAELPYAAAFLASQAFALYRKRGGTRSTPLPDFLIGAHAVAENMILMTRDARRYRDYFPALRLICPDAH